MFESRLLRNVFGPKRDEETGCCRKLHRDELHNLHSSLRQGNQIKKNETGGTIGESRGVYKVLVGNPEGKRLLGRPSRRWEDKIRMDLHRIGWKGVN